MALFGPGPQSSRDRTYVVITVGIVGVYYIIVYDGVIQKEGCHGVRGSGFYSSCCRIHGVGGSGLETPGIIAR